MKVLITGASGFLGSYVVKELQRLNYDIHTIGRSETSTIRADISKDKLAFKTAYDLVIHVAGKAHVVPKTVAEAQEFYDVNVRGTENLLNALEKKPAKFVFISSVSVYGLDFGSNITENAPLEATEPYGKSKIIAEEKVNHWGRKNNVTTTILRLPLLFGKNPPGNLKSMINAIIKKYYFTIGNGNVRKSGVFAKDVAAFIPKIAIVGGIYNLTDREHPSFKELSDVISLYFNLKKPIQIPYSLAWLMAVVGEVIQTIIKRKMPINKRQLKKITTPLTFNDDKAYEYGWDPISILKNENEWLNN